MKAGAKTIIRDLLTLIQEMSETDTPEIRKHRREAREAAESFLNRKPAKRMAAKKASVFKSEPNWLPKPGKPTVTVARIAGVNEEIVFKDSKDNTVFRITMSQNHGLHICGVSASELGETTAIVAAPSTGPHTLSIFRTMDFIRNFRGLES